MFKFRIIGFILLMALLGGIFFWEAGGVWLFIAAAPAMVAAAIGECCSMINKSGRPALVMPAALAVWLLAIGSTVSFIFPPAIYAVIILAALLLIAAAASLLTMDENIFQKILNTAGAILLFAPALIIFLCSFFAEPRAPGLWLLFLCLVTKATDTGGYIVGTLTAKLPGGNHKIAPRVSPKKSYEGLIGGLLLSLAVSLAFYFTTPAAAIWWYITAAIVLGFGSFFGDLTESAVKRFCNIKDSGSFVPGMGGAFDVLDSFIYNGILFWILFFIKDL
jgi:phosphatidate cytidylyltransferase